MGLEMAENLVERGLDVSLVEMASQVMPPLDKDMAKIVENHLIQKGVKLFLNEGFDGTENNGKTLNLKPGKKN
ncbi:FAD-dependent oxidoreductase [uncultured Peptoniphilus sp.]|uniref:NAD(P)/FAD-dependent oxidoreductase n=1 Tax=uncultured Peptoniphilus sp. TaxID=254354 RepID=UPI002804FCBF|nr:FAD-dependent oxidoreductase [uncultured Peptoniphilus sp.]